MPWHIQCIMYNNNNNNNNNDNTRWKRKESFLFSINDKVNVCLDTAYLLKIYYRKYYNKIIFKYVNCTVKPELY